MAEMAEGARRDCRCGMCRRKMTEVLDHNLIQQQIGGA